MYNYCDYVYGLLIYFEIILKYLCRKLPTEVIIFFKFKLILIFFFKNIKSLELSLMLLIIVSIATLNVPLVLR